MYVTYSTAWLVSARENADLLTISENKGPPAAFSSSVRSFWIQVPTLHDLFIYKKFWEELAHHCVL